MLYNMSVAGKMLHNKFSRLRSTDVLYNIYNLLGACPLVVSHCPLVVLYNMFV